MGFHWLRMMDVAAERLASPSLSQQDAAFYRAKVSRPLSAGEQREGRGGGRGSDSPAFLGADPNRQVLL
jgi:hypothetical protein